MISSLSAYQYCPTNRDRIMNNLIIKKGKQIKLISYDTNLLAGLVTIGIGILSMDSFSLGAIGFLLWAISPYLFAMFVTKHTTEHITTIIITSVSLILAIGGVSLLVDAIYIHTDAQSALAFMVIPTYQWIMLLIATLAIYIIHKRTK